MNDVQRNNENNYDVISNFTIEKGTQTDFLSKLPCSEGLFLDFSQHFWQKSLRQLMLLFLKKNSTSFIFLVFLQMPYDSIDGIINAVYPRWQIQLLPAFLFCIFLVLNDKINDRKKRLYV